MSEIPEFLNLQQVIAYLKNLRSRGEIKRWGKWLEKSEWYDDVRQVVYQMTDSNTITNLDRSEEVADLEDSSLQEKKIIQKTISGKKCIRILLDRSSDAQIRKNPIHRDESFQCDVCQRQVAVGGVQIRDHCPFCLHGLHLDIVPGDRSSDCKGLLIPKHVEMINAQTWIYYSCKKCEHSFRVRSHPDDDILSFLSKKSSS
mgnify:CR=1 FL=1